MTIYDMVYDEDHADIYNMLMNPTVVVDSIQNEITPGLCWDVIFDIFDHSNY